MHNIGFVGSQRGYMPKKDKVDKEEVNNHNYISTEALSLIKIKEQLPNELYLIFNSSFLVFPGMVTTITLEYDKESPFFDLIEKSGNVYIGVVSPVKDIDEDNISISKQKNRIGLVVKVIKSIKTEAKLYTLIIQGIKRFKIIKITPLGNDLLSNVKYLDDIASQDQNKFDAVVRNVQNLLKDVLVFETYWTEEFAHSMVSLESPTRLADFVGSSLKISNAQKQELLETLDLEKRLEMCAFYLMKELEVLKLGSKLRDEIKEKIDKHQHTYYLREQLKVIKKELGEEVDDKDNEILQMKEKMSSRPLNDPAMKKMYEEIKKLETMTPESPEYQLLRNYVSTVLDLPWGNKSEEQTDLKKASDILAEDHFGLEDVKDRIIEFLAVKKLNPNNKGAILCFEGPPGVGKTSLGKSIARALGRKFLRFSLGGMRDEAEIKGHRRTYIGSMPGRIMQYIKNAGVNNPVFMLDEIDKIGSDFRGDPASALLEVLDPEQNTHYVDHYIDVPFDLSRVMFIATANVRHTISEPLRDRMEIIKIPGYIDDEKREIAKQYLKKRVLANTGLAEEQVKITDQAITKIISDYTSEAGVRNLERAFEKIARKIAKSIVKEEKTSFVVTEKNLSEYLGVKQFDREERISITKPGISVGLAWTPVGGEVLLIEALRFQGKEDVVLTGQLGSVMNESARIAVNYIKSKSKELKVPAEFFKNYDLHIHFPAGAVQKDGPSAGIAIATALLSLASNKKIAQKTSMTGELTLSGRIMPVGGIREKIIAAKRVGIKRVILPHDNKKDLTEIKDDIKKDLEFYFVKDFSEVVKLAF